MRNLNLVTYLFFTLLLSASLAFGEAPICAPRGQVLPLDTNQVVNWIDSIEDDEFKAQAHIAGIVVADGESDGGHRRFVVAVGPAGNRQHIKVSYNLSYGPMEAPAVGSTIELCGEFTFFSGPSIHWVHADRTMNGGGWILLDGKVYGRSPSFDPYPREVRIEVLADFQKKYPLAIEDGITLNPCGGVKGMSYRNKYGFILNDGDVYSIDDKGNEPRRERGRWSCLEAFFVHHKMFCVPEIQPQTSIEVLGVSP